MPFSVRADRRLIRSTAPSRRFVRVEITAPEALRDASRIPRQPRLRHRPLRLDVGRQDPQGARGGDPGHPDPAPRGPLRRGLVRRPRGRRRPVEPGDARGESGGRGEDRRHRRTREHGPPRGLARRLRRGRPGAARRRRGPLPPADRRPGQQGGHGSPRDPREGGGSPAAPHHHLGVRRRRRFRREPPRRDRRGGRRELPLRRGRVADPRVHRGRGRRGARRHRPRRRARRRGGGGRARRVPQRLPLHEGQGDTWRIELGSLYGGQMLDPIVRLTLPGGPVGASREVRVRVEDREGALGAPSGAVSFTWAGHAENDAQERDRLVDRRVAFLFAARAAPRGARPQPGRRLRGRAPRVEGVRRPDPTIRRRRPRAARGPRRAGAEHGALRCGHGPDRPQVRPLQRDAEPEVAIQSAGRPPTATAARAEARPAGLRNSRARRPRRPRAPRPGRPRALHGRGRAARPGAGPPGLAPLPGRRDRPRLRGRPDRRVERHVASSSRSAAWPTTGSRTGTSCARPRSSRWPTGTARPPSPPRPSRPTRSSCTSLRLLGPSFAPEKLMHEDTRGCLFDFCESRGDVKAKLSAGRLCNPCRKALTDAGIPGDLVLNLLNAIRLLAATPPAVH